MRILGLNITRDKAAPTSLSSVDGRGGFLATIRESFTGAWQSGVTVDRNAVEAHHAVFACTTLIASDMAKLRIRLKRNIGNDVWVDEPDARISALLRKPNHFQVRPQFVEGWVLSKLRRGNTYALKQRNGGDEVIGLYVLDPDRVKPLIAPDGQVFYQLATDQLSGLPTEVIVPAREIIHDRWNCLFHPLVGLPPIYANGLAATHGLAIQNSQATLFKNAASPGGIVSAPGRIDPENAERLQTYWDTNFSGPKAGRVAVLGDGLKYERMSLSAEEAQLIDQLRLSGEIVCSTYHVPPFMVGLGPVPALGSIEALHLLYFGQAVQSLIEAMEACLDDGLELPDDIGTEFDLDGLLRMDTAARVKALAEAVGGMIMTPNEARGKLDLPPIEGGETVYAQQQDFSIAALAERDRNKPFATPTAT